ncbi:MAG: hypothetical protein AVO38_03185 [delta proteobacterium ML8_D]|nr:MAG: hypothetical protein AVO38_03185 [delta proteobacterium ML8_D]
MERFWVQRFKKKMNTEYRTSNIERRMGKEEEIEIAVECSVLDIRFSFDVERSMFDVHLSKQFRTL